MNKEKVYKDLIETKWVVSNQNENRQYEINFGEVDWERNGDCKYSVYVRIWLRFDNEWEWQNYSPHLVAMPWEDENSDFDNVLHNLNLMKKEYLSS